jgi:hypothetical protein
MPKDPKYGDSVVIKFIEDCEIVLTVPIIGGFLDDPVNFRKGQEYEVDIIRIGDDENDPWWSVQFADGSISYGLRLSCFEVVKE